MKTLFIECNMGAAGDMLMAALYELLEDRQAFLDAMNALGLPGVRVEAQAAATCGIAGTHMTVAVHGQEETEGSVPAEAPHPHVHSHGEAHGHDHDYHHHHDHDHEEHEHHHEHDHEEHEHHHEGHEHHHDHDCCGHDHHHHHADEVFTSWGKETPKKFTEEGIRAILDTLSKEDSDEYGIILRAKGIVPDENGKWIHFDLVPGEDEVRYGSAEYTGRICVIGSKLNEDKLAELFGL